MKTKLKYLTDYSLKKKINTKWFKVVNIILAILIIGICNIDRIITAFGGDFDEITKIVVVDEVGIYDLFNPVFNEAKNSLTDIKNYELVLSTSTLDEEKKSLNEDDNLIVINIKNDNTEIITADIYTFDAINTIDKQFIQSTLTSVKSSLAMSKLNLSNEEVSSIVNPITINTNTLNPDEENEEAKDLISTGLITILIVPLFLLITLLVQMIGAEINDEKSTRGMEIIISSVPVKYHFISKLVASIKFVLIQGGLLLGYGAIGILIRLMLDKSLGKVMVSSGMMDSVNDVLELLRNSGVIDNFLIALPIILILILSSFVIYSIVSSVLASMTTSYEDYQQLQTPLVLIMVVGYYIALMAAVFDGALFIKIMGYIPMFSFLIAPALYLLGQFSIVGLIIATLLNIVFLVIVYIFGMKIYKVGILNYSSSNLWKKIFKSIKS